MRPFLTLHDPAAARRHYEAGLWRQDTFYTLMAAHAERTPGSIALVDQRRALDWQALKAQVDALADNLQEHGLGVGDRLSVWMSNRSEVVLAFLACARAGIACNPSLHKAQTCAEVIGLLDTLKSSALITEPGWGADRGQQDFDTMLAGLPFLKVVHGPDTLPEHPADIGRALHDNPDSVAYLAFTSGTTGAPKCVMHSCNTLLANARDLVRDWKIDDTAVILTLSPLSHHIAWVAVGQWLVSGSRLVIGDPPAGMDRLDWIEKTGATYVLGVPTHAMDILTEQQRRGAIGLGRVNIFYMAGAPIPQVVAEAFLAQGITPQNIYGMTENSSHQYTHPDDPKDIWIRTCGRGGPAYEVRIWDPENRDIEMPTGTTGEIGGRGAAMMLGYFGNQEETEQTFNSHGFLMSGDLGSLDEHGNLRIEGRAKDLIIRGGHNIYPSRIEARALTHSRVERAAAFGVADERLGEKVCLAIVGDVSASELLEHLHAEGLSIYDMPEWFVRIPGFPLTASGKVLKRSLTDMVRTRTLQPEAVRFQPKEVQQHGR